MPGRICPGVGRWGRGEGGAATTRPSATCCFAVHHVRVAYEVGAADRDVLRRRVGDSVKDLHLFEDRRLARLSRAEHKQLCHLRLLLLLLGHLPVELLRRGVGPVVALLLDIKALGTGATHRKRGKG